AAEHDTPGEPRPCGGSSNSRAGHRVACVSIEPPVSPGIAQFACQLRRQLKTASPQRIERRPATPVEGQEATRLAGRRAADRIPLDHDRLRAATGEKVGDRRAAGDTTADD